MTRTRSPGWIPNQHGAWAMLVTPLLVGAIMGGLTWWQLWLAVAWMLGYFCFFAVSLWLKSRFKARYLPPVRGYAVATALVGVPLVALRPELLWWAPAFAPALAIGWYAAWRRDERALAAGLATVVAAMLMAPVAYQLGTGHVGGGAFADGAWRRIAIVTAVLFAYFGGTVFYVKSAIRERRSHTFLTVSVAWHATCTALVALDSPWLMLFFGALTIRAAVIPPRRWTPKQLGIPEILATTALAVVTLLVV